MGKQATNCPYSYHVFMFPFLWSGVDRTVEMEDFKKCLAPGWALDKDYFPHLDCLKDGMNTEAKKKLAVAYTRYHYFNPAARNVIYNGERNDHIVENLRYHAGDQTDYIINDYKLHVSQIRLKLFPDGVGILIFELQNLAFRSIAEVKKINDLGRRIFAPFLSYDPQEDSWQCNLCAQKLVLGTDGTKADPPVAPPAYATSTKLAQPILALLSNGEYTITADEERESPTCFFVEPIIDDRMFVACYLYDPVFSEQLKERVKGEYRYLHDAAKAFDADPDGSVNVARELYELIFIDGNGCTCQNQNMLRSLLEKHTYTRWLEYASISGVSDYSLITISSSDREDLINAFLTEYVEMAALTLAQRASLLHFSSWVSDIALLNSSNIGKKSGLEALHREYLKFKSQLLLKEVTPQQQGIELYQMLQEKMFISEQVANVESQIDSLFSQSQLDSGKRENWLLFILTLLTIADVVNCIFDWCIGKAYYRAFTFIVFLAIAMLTYRRKPKLK